MATLPTGENGKGFSFSLSFAPQPKKEKLNVNVFGIHEDDGKEKKIFFTEMKDNQIVGAEKKELVIPLKKPSWIEKAKERIAEERAAKEKNSKEEKELQNKETTPITPVDEARMSLLKGLMEDVETQKEQNLVIPLNPDQKQEKSKHIPMIMQNRMPGYETMDKEEYFQKELEVLPEACDVRGDSYQRIRIEDFGKAILRGMGWDGKENVDSSVYEIKPRPDRLGLGAMPLVMDKQRRKSAVKRSKADQEASKAYTGVKKEKEDMYAFRRGVQVGVVMGDDTGKQGMILESVPTTVQNVKVLLDGEKSMKVFTKAQLLLLSDLVKIQSFNDIYGRKESTQRSRSREPSYHQESSHSIPSKHRSSSNHEPSTSHHRTSSGHSRHSHHHSHSHR
ncbi:hypothetical protein WA171_004652 [Blastocystis sp. BT1]